MSGFYVDEAGLNELYNLLWQASGDVRDVLDYTKKHCNLDFSAEGYILYLAGPHDRAYKRMTDDLQRISTLCREAATQVNLAQRHYTSSDLAALTRLDQSFPGAKNPARLRGTLASGRPDLWPTNRAPFAAAGDVSQVLVAPNYATGVEVFEINLLSDLLSPAAWVRQASVTLFGHDPFEGWGKALSGDWEAYTHCAAAWRIAGNAMSEVGRNLITGAADVTTVWRGNAAEAEQEFQLALGAAAMAMHSICDQYAELYKQASEAAKHLFSAATNLIGKLIDALIVVNAAAIVGTATIKTGVGAVAGYGVAAYFAWQAYDLYRDISTVYSNAEVAFKGIAGLISAIDAKLGVAGLPDLKPYRHPAVA